MNRVISTGSGLTLLWSLHSPHVPRTSSAELQVCDMVGQVNNLQLRVYGLPSTQTRAFTSWFVRHRAWPTPFKTSTLQALLVAHWMTLPGIGTGYSCAGTFSLRFKRRNKLLFHVSLHQWLSASLAKTSSRWLIQVKLLWPGGITQTTTIIDQFLLRQRFLFASRRHVHWLVLWPVWYSSPSNDSCPVTSYYTREKGKKIKVTTLLKYLIFRVWCAKGRDWPGPSCVLASS